jgi:ribosomal protein S12 methylthiotransferase
MEQLVSNAQDLAKKGVKELLLIAQDLTYYGLDLYKKRNLSELLAKLSDVEGLEWIRLHYAFPAGFPMDVLEVIRERSNVCNYLDIPLQHGSTAMLQAMRRGITREKTEELLDAIRQCVPDIALRTTLISGFPGETEANFDEMKGFVERSRFDRLGIFTYSHEENTHAYQLADDVPEELKRKRADEIMEMQAGISHALNQQKVGRTFKTLFDRVEGDYFIGRTEFDSPEVDNEVKVLRAPDLYVPLGHFSKVRIVSAEPYDLVGEMV